jgi:hypothetical protein
VRILYVSWHISRVTQLIQTQWAFLSLTLLCTNLMSLDRSLESLNENDHFVVLDFVVHTLNVSWQISRVTQWIQTQLAFVVLDFGVHTLNVSWLISRVTQWIWTQTHIKFYISGAFGATEKRLVPNWREKSIPNINRDPDPQKNQTRLQSGFGIDKKLHFCLRRTAKLSA